MLNIVEKQSTKIKKNLEKTDIFLRCIMPLSMSELQKVQEVIDSSTWSSIG